MKVRYVHGKHFGGGHSVSSNIMWEPHMPMRKGEFPPEHPSNSAKEGIAAFAALGYSPSPLHEGDGFTFSWLDRSAAEVIADIEKCFGWEVTNKPTV
jgi:hypothetical protein